jgi:outer membrane lipoprotein carrier protein
MNKHTLTLTLLLCLSVLHLSAQEYTEATPDKRQEMQEKITSSTKKLKSLTCDFEQIKDLSLLNEKMTSTGRMYYQDNRVRWEYLSPYTFTFVFNNNKIMTITGASRNVIDVKSNNLFQEIVKIMISCMNGSGLGDTKNFNPKFFTNPKGEWMVTLTPQQKDVKRMFSLIKLFFNPKDYSVEAVAMEENNGDTTLIRLINKEINAKINDSLFSLD